MDGRLQSHTHTDRLTVTQSLSHLSRPYYFYLFFGSLLYTWAGTSCLLPHCRSLFFFFREKRNNNRSGWAQLNHRREILIGAALLNLCGAGTSQFRPRSFSYPVDYTHHNVFQKNGKKICELFPTIFSLRVLSFPPSSCSLHFTTRRNINYNK